MILMDTTWRPSGSGPLGGFIGEPAKGHVYAPDDRIVFPAAAQRTEFTCTSEEIDLWAGVLNLDDYGAFLSLGPAGRGEGSSEPAAIWQGTIDLLKKSVANAYDAEGAPLSSRDVSLLVESVQSAIRDEDLYLDATAGQLVTRARTKAAFLRATALVDIAAGRHLGFCEICHRRMVKMKSNQRFCGAKCRMTAHRENATG